MPPAVGHWTTCCTVSRLGCCESHHQHRAYFEEFSEQHNTKRFGQDSRPGEGGWRGGCKSIIFPSILLG